MRTIFNKFLLLTLISSGFAGATANSNYDSKEPIVPVLSEETVSAIQAEMEAKSIFCGLVGKGCDSESLKSKCITEEGKGNKLAAFKCNVYPKVASEGSLIEALRVNLDKNLAYNSSVRIERPAEINLEVESREPVKTKKGSQR